MSPPGVANAVADSRNAEAIAAKADFVGAMILFLLPFAQP
jgi:hypothetical protein